MLNYTMDRLIIRRYSEEEALAFEIIDYLKNCDNIDMLVNIINDVINNNKDNPVDVIGNYEYLIS